MGKAGTIDTPRGATRIEVPGKTVILGLIDMQVHYEAMALGVKGVESASGVDYAVVTWPKLQELARLLAAKGVFVTPALVHNEQLSRLLDRAYARIRCSSTCRSPSLAGGMPPSAWKSGQRCTRPSIGISWPRKRC